MPRPRQQQKTTVLEVEQEITGEEVERIKTRLGEMAREYRNQLARRAREEKTGKTTFELDELDGQLKIKWLGIIKVMNPLETPAGRPHLLEMLNDNSSLVRNASLEILGRRAVFNEDVLREVHELARRERSPSVLINATNLVGTAARNGRLNAEHAVPVLETIADRIPSLKKQVLGVGDGNQRLANALAHALLQTNHSSAIPLLEWLERKHGTGTEELELLDPKRGFEAAKNLLEGESPNVKGVDKMRELAKRGHEPAISYLVDNVGHQDEKIRDAIQPYVAALRHPLALPALSDLVNHHQTARKIEARKTVLALAEHQQARTVLEKMLEGAARAEKITILQAISQHHGGQTALEALREHHDTNVREIVTGMLAGMRLKPILPKTLPKTRPKPRPRRKP